jgi:hypothetical protein
MIDIAVSGLTADLTYMWWGHDIDASACRRARGRDDKYICE